MCLDDVSPGSNDSKQKRVPEHQFPGHQGGSQSQAIRGLSLPGLEMQGGSCGVVEHPRSAPWDGGVWEGDFPWELHERH